MRRSIVPMWSEKLGRIRDELRLLPSHRCDESPAGYSLASCSPAVLPSASPAQPMVAGRTITRRSKKQEIEAGEFSDCLTNGVHCSHNREFQFPDPAKKIPVLFGRR